MIFLTGFVGLAFLAWRAQLFTVSRPGDRPHALELLAESRPSPAFDVALPVVPVGMERLRSGDGPLLIHYWAPWERHGTAQARMLDSLAHLADAPAVRIVLVCFDPFPSVARFVGRNRLRVPVLLDGGRALRRALPCPSVPFTYVMGADGRMVVAQAGEIDWLAPGTWRTLEKIGLRGKSAGPPPSPA